MEFEDSRSPQSTSQTMAFRFSFLDLVSRLGTSHISQNAKKPPWRALSCIGTASAEYREGYFLSYIRLQNRINPSSLLDFFNLNCMRLSLVGLLAASVLISIHALGNTVTGPGNWDNTGIWSGANIADAITEDAAFNNNLGTITIRNSFNYTIGNVNMGNGNTLTIAAGGTLNVGASGNAKNFTTNNGTTINVNGTLIIWGDLVVNNDLVLVVTGTLIVKGNVTMNNGGALNVSGNVTIDGNFTGGNNTNLVVDGSVAVGGNISVGNGSTATGSGTVTAGGTCTDGSSTFCNQGPLPVTLIYFAAKNSSDHVTLQWATASELNFDYFDIERSTNGNTFSSIGTVRGQGTSTQRVDYSFVDNEPVTGKSYYRLRTVDFDDYAEYSTIVSVEIKNALVASIFPNPVVDGKLTVRFNGDLPSETKLVVFDLAGNQVLAQSIDNYAMQLPIDLQPGYYLVKIRGAGFLQTSRLAVK